MRQVTVASSEKTHNDDALQFHDTVHDPYRDLAVCTPSVGAPLRAKDCDTRKASITRRTIRGARVRNTTIPQKNVPFSQARRVFLTPIGALIIERQRLINNMLFGYNPKRRKLLTDITQGNACD